MKKLLAVLLMLVTLPMAVIAEESNDAKAMEFLNNLKQACDLTKRMHGNDVISSMYEDNVNAIIDTGRIYMASSKDGSYMMLFEFPGLQKLNKEQLDEAAQGLSGLEGTIEALDQVDDVVILIRDTNSSIPRVLIDDGNIRTLM